MSDLGLRRDDVSPRCRPRSGTTPGCAWWARRGTPDNQPVITGCPAGRGHRVDVRRGRPRRTYRWVMVTLPETPFVPDRPPPPVAPALPDDPGVPDPPSD